MGKIKAECLADTNAIADAVRQIRQDPSIVQEARRSIASALDRLGLQGTARQAVTPLLAAATSSGSVSLAKPTSFWYN